jgi:hypothetical protein
MTGERGTGGFGGPQQEPPPEFRSGLGQEGADQLQRFVEEGGTLLTFAEAGDFAIQKLRVPVRNVVADLPPKEFWSPGSTLQVKVDTGNPLAYGMPESALATFLDGGQVYEIVPSIANERAERIVTFADRDILQSGWLLGESVIANKAAMVAVGQGRGRVVMIGFRAQHRAQTHGTFKLVFDALLGGPPE